MLLPHFLFGTYRHMYDYVPLVYKSNSIIKCCYGSDTQSKIPDIKPVKLQDWRKLYAKKEPVSSEDVEPPAAVDTSFKWFNFEAPAPNSFYVGNISNWYKHKEKQFHEHNQKYDVMMHKKLGSNLAAAYFVLRWHGKVKFQNKDWMQATKEVHCTLPGRFDPTYVITDIDASETLITYNGLKNMTNLKHLKWLSFKGCNYIDDWCVDKIAAQYEALEYLDISDCPKISERGLEAIYKLFNLQKLIVTNHYKSAAFELTCFMLEEVNPKLQCEIIVPQEKDKPKEWEKKRKY